MGETAGTSNTVKRSQDASATPEVLTFEHPIFTKMKDALFMMHHQSNEPVMSVNISDNQALLPFPGLKREFKLGEADCAMLDLLSEGLKYVNGLRIGDPLPKEITTGEATWELSHRHVVIAHQRVSMQLVNWLTGDERLITDPDALIQLAEDPVTKKKVNEAFGEAAERLGLGRENKQGMLKYVEKLSMELAYVEALRDKFNSVVDIRNKMDGLRQVYARERSVAQILDQLKKLFEIAVKDFSKRFLELDAQTGEILSVLKNLENQVLYIREKRDDLHVRLMAWEDIIREWKKVEVCVSYHINATLGRLYQFLAPRFMKVDDWVLMTQLKSREVKLEDLQKKNKVLVW